MSNKEKGIVNGEVTRNILTHSSSAALAVLRVASETCSGALKALQDHNMAAQTPDYIAEAPLETRLNDYSSLLSLLYQNTSKLAIALKPSSLEYVAAMTPARELATQVDALASCACSVNDVEHGHALAREVRWSAEDVLSALKSLLGVYTSDAHVLSSVAETEAGEPYLVRTGVVHEAIERARGAPRTNREAVKKRWDGILGGLRDCEKEVQEMIEEEENEDDEDDNGQREQLDLADFGDSLGQLSSSPGDSIRASQEELARLKLAHSLFKFTHALAKRMDLTILRPSSRMPSPHPRLFDKLLSNADKLLRTSDDLVPALYIPQIPGTISTKSKDLEAIVYEMRSEMVLMDLVTRRQDGQVDEHPISHLSQKTAALILQDLQGEEAILSKERRWFDTCFAQIFKTTSGLA